MQIPNTMAAVVLTGQGGLDKLEFHSHWPVPEPAAGEVLIRVGACGMNNTDINTRTGWYASTVTTATGDGGAGGFEEADGADASWGGTLKFPRIQGADACGEVVALGPDAPRELLNRRVLIDPWLRDWADPLNRNRCGYFGSERDGGFAGFTAVPARNAHPIDCALSDAELATFPTAYITAENMLQRAQVAAGDTVLIPGASGGVGSALVQLSARRGATPIAMTSAGKTESVKSLGAEVVLPRAPDDLRAALSQATGSDQVDVVADVVGGPVWPRFIDVLARGGRYTVSGAIAGPIVELDLRDLYLKDLTFTGATITPPDLFAQLVGYIEREEIRPLLAATWPLADIREAQTAFLEKKHVGNFVLIP